MLLKIMVTEQKAKCKKYDKHSKERKAIRENVIEEAKEKQMFLDSNNNYKQISDDVIDKRLDSFILPKLTESCTGEGIDLETALMKTKDEAIATKCILEKF